MPHCTGVANRTRQRPIVGPSGRGGGSPRGRCTITERPTASTAWPLTSTAMAVQCPAHLLPREAAGVEGNQLRKGIRCGRESIAEGDRLRKGISCGIERLRNRVSTARTTQHKRRSPPRRFSPPGAADNWRRSWCTSQSQPKSQSQSQCRAAAAAALAPACA